MIEIENLSKIYDGQTVVENVSLKVPAGSITTVVGTSGSGKTTLLRMINRLVEPSSGTIRVNGEDNRAMAPHELRRRIGYAIQGHGLFPHRTVFENIATVPRLLGWRRTRIYEKVHSLLELFQLSPADFSGRYPHELSGGQQQRVGVARALAAEPSLLLMDEPFGALDPIIRAKAQDDLLTIQRQLKTTILLVTHDMEEAFQLGDRIAVMHAGRLVQYAKPEAILRHPASEFVSSMVGSVERPFRLLSLGTVNSLTEPGEAQGDAFFESLSQRDALARLLWEGRDAAPVVTENGERAGRVTLARLIQSASEAG
ncbi:ABC transporter ATP-binding protein [Rhizobium helianthi]|uniref:ABC transporter ATP-binding protein n=1 Tax=Rhizobium helianthi TaxID=1132695 RepID=A0ABW4LZQ2_9HYPH